VIRRVGPVSEPRCVADGIRGTDGAGGGSEERLEADVKNQDSGASATERFAVLGMPKPDCQMETAERLEMVNIGGARRGVSGAGAPRRFSTAEDARCRLDITTAERTALSG
jgi:hypothetical protein